MTCFVFCWTSSCNILLNGAMPVPPAIRTISFVTGFNLNIPNGPRACTFVLGGESSNFSDKTDGRLIFMQNSKSFLFSGPEQMEYALAKPRSSVIESIMNCPGIKENVGSVIVIVNKESWSVSFSFLVNELM